MTSKEVFNEIARKETEKDKARQEIVLEAINASKNMAERSLQIIKESETKNNDLKNLIYDLLIILKQSHTVSVNLLESMEHKKPYISDRGDGDIEIRVYDEELYQYIESILE